jgi:hypothetical protein
VTRRVQHSRRLAILGLEWFRREGNTVTPLGVADFSSAVHHVAKMQEQEYEAQVVVNGKPPTAWSLTLTKRSPYRIALVAQR